MLILIFNFTGRVLSTASTNGVGSDAYFNGIQDILPIDGGREVLVADLLNHCIRKVDTQTRVVSTFAGICGRAVPLPDKSSLALKTVLEFPQKIIANEEEDTFYYLLHDRVVKHDILSG
ncbi:hypothetical protein EB796_007697 [Bugula neritina]|uniref:Uncharacterized protein n=1 Tax=Bugula neritina TaxID=10212 RepID=A0A7J7K7S5_BUGNE|nr:hypothetical protein EB796_007697 [Bugula neritina]